MDGGKGDAVLTAGVPFCAGLLQTVQGANQLIEIEIIAPCGFPGNIINPEKIGTAALPLLHGAVGR